MDEAKSLPDAVCFFEVTAAGEFDAAALLVATAHFLDKHASRAGPTPLSRDAEVYELDFVVRKIEQHIPD
jgi:hypothetical protein